jgi:hypothetical protein
MGHTSKYRITCEFDFNGNRYIAWLCPYYELSDQELKIYHITEYNYVVHLFSLEGFKTFEMFLDDDLHWISNAPPLLIDTSIIEIISYVLVKAFL